MTGPTVFNNPSLGGGFGTPTLTWSQLIASGSTSQTQDVRLELQFSTTAGTQASGISFDAELVATYFSGGYAEQITMDVV
jgi:hypothetical protein